uniref:Uncharacterized protein n=1 Tax=Arundo donax TaxID=35708 RepID=A0A0A9FLE9_ARUDO
MVCETGVWRETHMAIFLIFCVGDLPWMAPENAFLFQDYIIIWGST